MYFTFRWNYCFIMLVVFITHCSADVGKMPLIHILLFSSPIIISNMISVFCGYQFARTVRKHLKVVQTRQWESRLQEIREILYLIIIQLVVPLSFETSMTISPFIFNDNTPTALKTLVVCLFLIRPVTDPIILMFVMKPYRNLLQNWWHKIKPPTTVTMITVTAASSELIAEGWYTNFRFLTRQIIYF